MQLVTPEDGTIEVLPIHFDVPEHYIPLRTFIDTASHAEEIVASLNAEWFAGELDYEVVVIPPKPRETYEARNEFYQACWQEKELRAIGFDESNQFPIDRKDFARLQVPLEPRDEVPEVEPSTVQLTSVTVTSPNWDRRDATRTWRGKDASGKYRYFKANDESFWALADANGLNLQGLDTKKVQWAFQGRGRQAKNFRVLRGLDYNGHHLADPYEDAALDGILGAHTKSGSNQDDLFGRR